MLKVSFLEIIIRGIPEVSLFMAACYILSGIKFYLNQYLLSTTLLILATCFVRTLPINPGINIMLILLIIIVINIKINKISIIKSISVSVSAIILQSFSEFINILIIKYFFKLDLTMVWGNTTLKIIYGIPSLVLFLLLVIVINAVLNKRKLKKEEIA